MMEMQEREETFPWKGASKKVRVVRVIDPPYPGPGLSKNRHHYFRIDVYEWLDLDEEWDTAMDVYLGGCPNPGWGERKKVDLAAVVRIAKAIEAELFPHMLERP
jgi:hypothetical protein